MLIPSRDAEKTRDGVMCQRKIKTKKVGGKRYEEKKEAERQSVSAVTVETQKSP
jgi:hypothetical protein